jgi:hypothetical protein
MGPMPSQYSFTCPDCGTDWPCPEYIVTDYSGRTVTRWCETCRHLFDIKVPPAPPSEAPS